MNTLDNPATNALLTEGVNLGNKADSVQDKNDLQGFDAQLSVNKSQANAGMTNKLASKDAPSMEGG